ERRQALDGEPHRAAGRDGLAGHDPVLHTTELALLARAHAGARYLEPGDLLGDEREEADARGHALDDLLRVPLVRHDEAERHLVAGLLGVDVADGALRRDRPVHGHAVVLAHLDLALALAGL